MVCFKKRERVLSLALTLILFLTSFLFAGQREEKLISLAPNITEIVCFLDGEKRLVGITSDCNYPSAVRSKRKIGRYLYPDLEKIVELQPAIVLMEDTVDKRFLRKLKALDIEYRLYNFRSLDKIFYEINKMSKELDLNAEKKLTKLQNVYKNVKRKNRGVILIVINQQPLIAAGDDTFISDFFEKMGYKNILKKGKYPLISREVFYKSEIDLIVNLSDSKIKLNNDSIKVVEDMNRDIMMRLSPRLILEYEKISL